MSKLTPSRHSSSEKGSGGLNRRDLFKATAAGAVLASVPLAQKESQATPVKTSAHIVIAGAGAAGLSVASRLAERFDGAKITIIDARKAHYYQPGYTLVAAGLKSKGYVTSTTKDYLPSNIDLIEQAVQEFDPEGNSVTTASGQKIKYDYLVVATGMILDYAAIEGMDTDRIGQDGLGSVYHSPEKAEATWQAMSRFADEGGQGLFLRPATEMKCAGAPLKYTFITDDYLRRRGTRKKTELVYAAHNKTLFSVPIVNEKVRMLYLERDIKIIPDRVMTGIDLSRKVGVFSTPEGQEEIPYDFVNVIPPMRAPNPVRYSPLAWQTGAFAYDGWMEVDKKTLRHERFDNIWAVGDIAGVPKGKTAASVKWQVPVAVDQIVATVDGKTSDSFYNGYTSCPLITQLGRAMLVEFDYQNNLVPSFPGVIAPLEELWITWVMKTMALKPTYLSMLRGQA